MLEQLADSYGFRRLLRNLTEHDWMIDVEMLALAQKFDYKIKEVPVSFTNNDFGVGISFIDYWRVICQTLKIRRTLMDKNGSR